MGRKRLSVKGKNKISRLRRKYGPILEWAKRSGGLFRPNRTRGEDEKSKDMQLLDALGLVMEKITEIQDEAMESLPWIVTQGIIDTLDNSAIEIEALIEYLDNKVYN